MIMLMSERASCCWNAVGLRGNVGMVRSRVIFCRTIKYLMCETRLLECFLYHYWHVCHCHLASFANPDRWVCRLATEALPGTGAYVCSGISSFSASAWTGSQW